MGRAHRVALVAAFALLVAVLTITPISNNDIWLHLTTGGLILERGSVPRVEEYTFTHAGAPIVDHEWLAQVLFAAAHGLAGLGALTAMKLALTATTVLLVFLRCRRSIDGTSPEAAAPSGPAPATLRDAAAATAALGATLLIATHLFIRPHLFSFLLAAAYPMILPGTDSTDRRRRVRALAALLGLQILWVNLHGGFVIGILIAAVHAAGRTLSERRLALPSALTVPALAAVSLVNPYAHRIYYLVGEFTEPAFRRNIVEWRSPFAHPFVSTPLFWVYVLWLALAGAAAARAFRRGEFVDALAAPVFMALSVSSRRHASLMGVITAPAVARLLAAGAVRWKEARGRRTSPAAGVAREASKSALRKRREDIDGAVIYGRTGSVPVWSVAGAIIALSAFIGTVGVPWERDAFRRPGFGVGENIPVEALRVVHDERLTGRVFNTLAFGAYVTFSGWPDLRTYIDSRLEVMGGTFLQEYERMIRSPELFGEMERKTPLDLALISWQFEPVAGVERSLSNDESWALIYFDDLAALWVKRTGARAELLERRAYRMLRPLDFVMGGFPGNADPILAEREARRAVSEVPVLPGRPAMNGIAHSMLGAALHRLGRPRDAAMEFRAAIAARPDADVAYGLLGLSLLEIGDRKGAREAFVELKRRVPASTFADRMLAEIDSSER